MPRDLVRIVRELGLAQYLDSLVDQGFDTWDTILDIQESDLDALGMKLGHRRKLQRRIALARGIAPSTSLSSLKQDSEQGNRDATAPVPTLEHGEVNSDGAGIVKRKYRRHPKPDEHAPERPPSAYVLFSNKMREDLKGHNLTFTEIAKLVGENWQSLPPAERETYEKQASAAKESYHRELAEYKKTPEYRKYAQYLQDFKEKHSKRAQDSSKRHRIEPTRQRQNSIRNGLPTPGTTPSTSSRASASTSTSTSTRDSRSSSERTQGSEVSPFPRDNKVDLGGIVASPRRLSQSDPSVLQTMQDLRFTPQSSQSDRNVVQGTKARGGNLRDGNRAAEASRQSLPPLSDMLDDGLSPKTAAPPNSAAGAFAMSGPPAVGAPLPPTPNGRRAMAHPDALPPMVGRGEALGNSNMAGSSGSPVGNPGRLPGDGALPVHALLSGRSAQGTTSAPVEPTAPASNMGVAAHGAHQGPRGYGFQSASSALQHMKVEQPTADSDVVMTSQALPTTTGLPQKTMATNGPGKNGLDGMSALLQAGEIVGRRSGE